MPIHALNITAMATATIGAALGTGTVSSASASYPLDFWHGLARWAGTTGFAGVVASIAAMITIFTARKKQREDIWWQRVEWGLTHYFGAEESAERETALGILTEMASSRLGGIDGTRLLLAASAIISQDTTAEHTRFPSGQKSDTSFTHMHEPQDH
ncbi:hypothetical protein [Mycetocola saprophilus]|uniref:hypothetical protein n=1 Tax=Mycetocola saprophilus TaxID=76636 RepID=UPI0004BF7A46|nr:hypothetical protein [Mycetocola saprophilus]